MSNSHATLSMEIFPDILQVIIEEFDLEMECLRGTKETLPDGRIKLEIVIESEEKAEMVKEFVLKLISKSHEKNMN